MIRLLNLTKKYDEENGIFDINLKINKGGSVGVVGPNGAGKTTLIKSILGMLKNDSGNVFINELDPFKKMNELMKIIGYIPGEVSLFEDITAKKFLWIIASQKEVVEKKYLNFLIEYFDIDITKKIKKLSKGNKQKIAIVSALMHKPRILILDEPTSGLDPVMQIKFNKLVLKMKKEYGTTIFICSHIFDEVSEICERVIFLKKGKIVREFQIKNSNITEVKNEFQKIFIEGLSYYE